MKGIAYICLVCMAFAGTVQPLLDPSASANRACETEMKMTCCAGGEDMPSGGANSDCCGDDLDRTCGGQDCSPECACEKSVMGTAVLPGPGDRHIPLFRSKHFQPYLNPYHYSFSADLLDPPVLG